MVDRRFLIAAVVAVLVGFGVRAAVSSPPGSSSAGVPGEEPRPVTTLGPAVSPAIPVDDRIVGEQVDETSDPMAAAVSPTGPTQPSTTVELVDLVQQRRPEIDDIAVPREHAHEDGEHVHPNEGAEGVERLAGEVVVAGWTWRFDDDVTRHARALASIADATVVEALSPTAAERVRRVETGEVSWVIVRNVSVDGAAATVTFDQHVVAASSAETVASHIAVVTVTGGVVVEVTF